LRAAAPLPVVSACVLGSAPLSPSRYNLPGLCCGLRPSPQHLVGMLRRHSNPSSAGKLVKHSSQLFFVCPGALITLLPVPTPLDLGRIRLLYRSYKQDCISRDPHCGHSCRRAIACPSCSPPRCYERRHNCLVMLAV
jgi:hypothetical protein